MLGFRVWDSKDKRFLDDTLHFCAIGHDGNLLLDQECAVRYIPMQSTGLSGKNGTIIYESDILEVAGGSKIVVNDLKDFLIYCGRYEEKNGVELLHSVSVVGNIYENGDML